MLRNLCLKCKLMSGYGVVLLALAVCAVFSILEIRALTSVVSSAVAIHEMSEVGTLATDMIGLERAIVLYSIFDDKVALQSSKARLDDSSKAFTAALDKITGSTADSSVRTSVDALRNRYGSWLAMHNELVGYLEHQQVDVAQKKLADASFLSTVDDMRRMADEMSTHAAQTLTSRAAATQSTSMIGFPIIGIGSLIVGIFVYVYIKRINGELSALTISLAGSSSQVEGLSAGVHASSESLAKGSSAQAAALEQTSASTEEITAMTRQNVEDSQAAAAVMSQVDGFIKAGNRTLESMVLSMAEIKASSDKISKIIRVIDEIAFQTNILALNAAVEAARAGEAGMGFAVVADEVRNLAQRSAQAAKDTAAMIEESIARSQDGTLKLAELSEMIRSITDSAAKVKTLVDSVNVGSQEQARGISQIATAVSQMEQMTQATAANAQEGADASDQLSGQATSLHTVVNQLRILVDGSARR